MRWFGRLLALYLILALGTRLAEAVGINRCGCASDCWCKRPVLSTFRWVFPYGHRGLEPAARARFEETPVVT